MRSTTSPCRLMSRLDSVRVSLQLIVAGALLISPSAYAVGNRFVISAAASLHPVPAAQTTGRFELRATLATQTAEPQSALGYSLTARIAAQPLVCTSDTIFMDGFDG